MMKLSVTLFDCDLYDHPQLSVIDVDGSNLDKAGLTSLLPLCFQHITEQLISAIPERIETPVEEEPSEPDKQ